MPDKLKIVGRTATLPPTLPARPRLRKTGTVCRLPSEAWPTPIDALTAVVVSAFNAYLVGLTAFTECMAGDSRDVMRRSPPPPAVRIELRDSNGATQRIPNDRPYR
jgi:hypothetical protein